MICLSLVGQSKGESLRRCLWDEFAHRRENNPRCVWEVRTSRRCADSLWLPHGTIERICICLLQVHWWCCGGNFIILLSNFISIDIGFKSCLSSKCGLKFSFNLHTSCKSYIFKQLNRIEEWNEFSEGDISIVNNGGETDVGSWIEDREMLEQKNEILYMKWEDWLVSITMDDLVYQVYQFISHFVLDSALVRSLFCFY